MDNEMNENLPEQEEIAPVSEETVPAEVQETPKEEKTGIHLTPGKLALLICGVVALTAVVLALILQGMGVLNFSAKQEAAPTDPTEATGIVVEPTIPADGNPDDVTCKGTYSVSDEEALAAADVVVATMGDKKLTNGQLQIYYWMQVQQFLSNYGSYASYFGLDYTQPLDMQLCGVSEIQLSWQQYFLDGALNNWQNYQSMAAEAVKNGVQINAETQAQIDALPAEMAAEAAQYGYEDAEKYLAANMGAGATIADYVDHLQQYYLGYEYFSTLYDGIQPTDEELEAYFDAHAAAYADNGITKDSMTVDVRHILVFPEGGTQDENGTTVYSEEEWEACRQRAQEILDAWLEGDADEDSFAALANEKSEDPGSNTNGGLYAGVTRGEMVEPFDTWIFDETRQEGDTDLVRTSYGYHVMYFVGRQPLWRINAENDFLDEQVMSIMDSILAANPIEVDFSKIVLGVVKIG